MPVNIGETGRRPDLLHPIEKERINTMVTSPVARLMAVTLCPDRPDILKPNVALDMQKSEDVDFLHSVTTGIQDKASKREIDYMAVEALSLDSRTDYWEKKKQEAEAQGEDLSSFAKQNEHWNNGIAQWLEKNTDISSIDTTVQERIKTLQLINLDVTKPEFTQTQDNLNVLVENFRKKYLKGGSNIKQFVEDIANGCKENNDQTKPVNLQTLENRLNTVEDLFSCFGEKAKTKEGDEKDNVVNRLINDYVITHSLLTQNREEITNEIAAKAVNKIKEKAQDPAEQDRLHILFEYHNNEPPVQSDTTPAPIFDRGDHQTKQDITGGDAGALDQQATPDHDTSADTGKDRELVADAGGRSEWGGSHGRSQDALFVKKDKGAFGVFDGLGSYALSDRAAWAASNHLEESLTVPELDGLTFDQTKEQVVEEMQNANKKIRSLVVAHLWDVLEKEEGAKEEEIRAKYTRDELQEKLKKIRDRRDGMVNKGMTTAAVVKIWQGKEDGEQKRRAILSWLGDSRIYLMRDGELACKTVDDTLLPRIFVGDEAWKAQYVQDKESTREYEKYKDEHYNVYAQKRKEYEDEEIEVTITGDEQAWYLNFLREEGYHWTDQEPFKKGQTRKLKLGDFELSGLGQWCMKGLEDIEPNTAFIDDLKEGDRILITSDGVHDQLREPVIEAVLTEHPDAKDATDALFEKVKHVRGGLVDDTTAVVINI